MYKFQQCLRILDAIQILLFAALRFRQTVHIKIKICFKNIRKSGGLTDLDAVKL